MRRWAMGNFVTTAQGVGLAHDLNDGARGGFGFDLHVNRQACCAYHGWVVECCLAVDVRPLHH